MNEKRFTVIVPTRERCLTLLHTIKTCLAQDYDNYEVLVSDNNSADDTKAVVRSFSDSRLRYINPGKRLSMTAHFNFAISHAREGIICALGDDDGLMPRAIINANSIMSDQMDLPLACSSVFYSWPDYPDSASANKILIRDTRDIVTRHDAKTAVYRRITFQDLSAAYIWGLPGIYRGFVPTKLVEKACCGGAYIRSVTPDAYSAFVTALQSGAYIYTTKPLFVEGVSGRSNGASQTFQSSGGEETQYLAENDLPIHQDMVYSPASPFVMIEAFLQVKANFPALTRGLDPDLNRMCSLALREAKGPKLRQVASAIQQLAHIHNIDQSRGLITRIERIQGLWNAIKRTWRMIEIDGASYGVRDVYGAMIAAQAALNERQKAGKLQRMSLIRKRINAKLSLTMHTR